jgi:hypothetical protein
MPAAIYALASDTLIGVVCAQAATRQRADGAGLGDDGPDLLVAAGRAMLRPLRLLLAGPSTLRGFRAWVIEKCPVAPGPATATETRPLPAAEAARVLTQRPAHGQQRRRQDGQPTKRDRLVSLAAERRDLTVIPLGEVSRLATALAAEIGYSAGTARRELIRHVRQLQSGPAESVSPGRGNGDVE